MNKSLISGCCVMMMLVGCTGEDKNSSGAAPIDDSYKDELNIEELDFNAGATATVDQLTGTWGISDEDGSQTITLNADGSGTYRETEIWDGEQTSYSAPLTWEVDNSVLSAVLSERFTEDGLSCTETDQVVTTVAVVNNGLVMDALLRTAGTGNGYAGTWKAVFGEYESAQCGNEWEKYSGFEEITLQMTADSFVLNESWKGSEEWNVSGDSGSDSDSDAESLEGTITDNGDYLVLEANDDYGTVLTARLLNNNVLQLSWNDPEYALDGFENDIYRRQ